MDEKQKNSIVNIITILAIFGFLMPLTCLLFAFIFTSDFIQAEIKEFSKYIAAVFVLFSIFQLTYPFLINKFYKTGKKYPLRNHIKWLFFGLSFSYLGVALSTLNQDMNYAYAGVLVSLVIAIYVITYTKIPVKIVKNKTQIKVMGLIGAMNLIVGSIITYIPLSLSDVTEMKEPLNMFFWGMIKHMGILTLGFGLGILYVLFVLFRKKEESLEFFDE